MPTLYAYEAITLTDAEYQAALELIIERRRAELSQKYGAPLCATRRALHTAETTMSHWLASKPC